MFLARTRNFYLLKSFGNQTEDEVFTQLFTKSNKIPILIELGRKTITEVQKKLHYMP